MGRFEKDQLVASELPGMRTMFGRTLACWASDLLATPPSIQWNEDNDPIADYRDRDWSKLYTGSVLDD